MAIDVVANMKGRVGKQNRGLGDDVQPWSGRQGDLVTLPFGKYYQAVMDGMVYWATTPDGGVAPGTDSASTTQAVSLYNANGTGVNLVVIRTSIAYVSGTLGAGELMYTVNTNPAAAAVTGTAMTRTNAKLGVGAGAATPLYSATVPAAPTLLGPAYTLDASLASTVSFLGVYKDDIDGQIIVQPGTSFNMAADAAAGSTPLIMIGIVWIEVPV